MTLYLRDSDRNTILDVEFNKNKDGYLDLRSVVVIKSYSKLLLDNLDRSDEVVEDFSFLSELRGWLWETVEFKDASYEHVLEELKKIFVTFGDKYGLVFIID
jgi:hypothetical protein